jgi:hypothetical protein
MAMPLVENERAVRGAGERTGPLLLDATGVAAMLHVSVRQLQRLRSSGRFGVLPLRLGARCLRFDVQELRAWVAAGCPRLAEWRAMKATSQD